MNELSPRAREALKALEDDAPTTEDLVRLEHALAARIAMLPPVGAGTGAAAKAGLATKASLTAKVIVAVSLVTGAGAVIALRSDSPTTPPPPPLARPAAVIPQVEVPHVDEVPPAREPPALDSTGVEPPDPRRAVRRSAPPSIAEPPPALIPEPPSPARPPGLAEELALLQDARRALAARDYARVLELVQRHREQFSAGVLSVERDALEARAKCGDLCSDAGRE
jgi:hypothetical protein